MPSYRQRLRIEGLVLAGCGIAWVVALLALAPGATDGSASTLIQLAMVFVLMSTLGVVATRRALAEAAALPPGFEGSGQPTALWKLPLIVTVLTLAFGLPVGWDAGLRVCGGCVIVGLAQAFLLERLVAADEARRALRYYRVPGSRIVRGTRLGTIGEGGE